MSNKFFSCIQGCFSFVEMLFFLALGVLSTLFFFHILGNQGPYKCIVLQDMDVPVMYAVGMEKDFLVEALEGTRANSLENVSAKFQ